MRSRLKSVKQIIRFQTDLDNQTATITYSSSLDLERTLDRLAKVNDKIADWTIDETTDEQ